MADYSILTRSFWTIERLSYVPLILLFVTGFFLGTAAHRMVFYISSPVLIYGLIYFVRQGSVLFQTKSALLIGAYLGYFLVSTLWSDPYDGYAVFRRMIDAVCILVFSASLANAAFYSKFTARSAILIAAICAVFSVAYCLYFYGVRDLTLDRRLLGMGRYENPIHLAGVLAMATLLLMSLKFTGDRRLQWQAALLGLIFFLVIFFSHTRSALVAIAGCFCVLMMMQSLRVSLFLLVGGGVAAVIGYFAWGQSFSELYERGDTFRLAIWSEAISRIVEAPLVGYGISTDPAFLSDSTPHSFKSTHNMILGHLYHGGGIGLLAYLGLIGHGFYVAFSSLWKHRGTHDGCKLDILRRFCLLSLVFSVIMGVFNFAHYMMGVHIQWLLFWVPISLAWYLEMEEKRLKSLSV